MKVPFTDEINTLGYYFEATRYLDVPRSVTKVEINSEITTLKENAFLNSQQSQKSSCPILLPKLKQELLKNVPV